MNTVTVMMKTTTRPHTWEEHVLPVSREWLEDARAKWRQWLKDHPSPLESDHPSNGAALSVTGGDALKITGFDKLLLGVAIVTKTIKYV